MIFFRKMLNKKDVSIKLISRQSDGENNEETELFSQGEYEKIDGGYKISYDETEATGFEGSTTSLTVTNNKVVMDRYGKVSSNLIVELGTKHHCVYGTPYGDFMIGVNATSIVSNLDDNGGKLDFHYVIDINSSYLGDFDISVEVK